MRHLVFIAAILSLIHVSISVAADFPKTLNYQGALQTKTGQQVNTPQDITFSLYSTPVGAELPFWTDTLANVPVTNGQFSVTLGTVTPLDLSKFGGETYIGVKVGSQAEMLPRQKMTSVPYAFNGIPSGGIIMWSGVVVPAGWVLCDGNNSTPNLREKFIIGSSNAYAIGSTGGEASHVLTVSEMPSHNHDGATGTMSANHSHNIVIPRTNDNNTSSSSQGFLYHGDDGLTSNVVARTTGAASADHAHSISLQGSGTPHNNLPPYYALAFIMKL